MKRNIWVTLLCVLAALSFSAQALADSETTSIREMVMTEKKAFSFRNGITWGMTPEQVGAAENTEMETRTSPEWAVMLTAAPVSVSRFTADLVYIFYQNALRMITYEFQKDCSTLNFQYLTGALCSLYGEQKDTDPAVVRVLMDAVNPGRYTTEGLTRAYAWVTADGTAVFQYQYAPDSFGVMYAAPELGGGLYQTNGL